MNKKILLAFGFFAALLLYASPAFAVDYTDVVGPFGQTDTWGGSIVAYQILANKTGTLNTLGVDCSTCTGNMKLAIYGNSSGSPGALLTNSTNVTAANGWLNATVGAVTITAGNYYWIAVQGSSTVTLAVTTTLCPALGYANAPVCALAYKTFNYQDFPSTYPAGDTQTNSEEGSILMIYTLTPVAVSNNLTISNSALSPSAIWSNSTFFYTNITVTNATTNATVGSVYASINGLNYTMFKIANDPNVNGNGGIYSYNNTITGVNILTTGNYTFNYYATETVTNLNQTNSSQTQTLSYNDFKFDYINYTTIVNETQTQNYTIEFHINFDLVNNITALLDWNGTLQGSETYNQTNSTAIVGIDSFTPPLIQANNSQVQFNFTYNISYNNGTTLQNQISATNNQNITFGYYFNTLTVNPTNPFTWSKINATGSANQSVANSPLPNNQSMALIWWSNTSTNTSFLSGSPTNYWGWYPIMVGNISDNNATISFNVTYNVTWNGTTRSQTGQGNVNVIAYRVQIGACNALLTNYTLNYYTYNETDGLNSTLGAFNTTVDSVYTLYDGVNITNNQTWAFEQTGANKYTLCIYPSTASVQADANIRYFLTTDNLPRNYYISNATVSNTTTEVDLYVLDTADATKVLINLKDTSGNLMQGVIIKFLKYYQGSNIFKTVDMVQTDVNGQAITWLNAYKTFYELLYQQNYKIVKTDVPTTINCPDLTNCQDNLLISTTNTLETYQFLGKISGSCTYVNSTQILTCRWNDNSGLSPMMCLQVSNVGALQNTQLTNSCVASTAGVLAYTFQNYNSSATYNYFFRALVPGFNSNSTLIDSNTITFNGVPTYGVNGSLLAFLVIATLGFVGLFNPPVSIILVIASTLAMALVGWVTIGVGAASGLVLVGLIIIYRMRRQV